MVTRKNAAQIALMRRAGKVVAEMHEVCTLAARPGATTLDVDRVARWLSACAADLVAHGAAQPPRL